MTVQDGGDRVSESALYSAESKGGHGGTCNRKSEEVADQLVEMLESSKFSFIFRLSACMSFVCSRNSPRAQTHTQENTHKQTHKCTYMLKDSSKLEIIHFFPY